MHLHVFDVEKGIQLFGLVWFLNFVPLINTLTNLNVDDLDLDKPCYHILYLC